MLNGVPSPICWIHEWRDVRAVAANQDQNGGQFLLLRPVIMRGGLACGHRVSPHGRTVSFVRCMHKYTQQKSKKTSRPTEVDCLAVTQKNTQKFTHNYCKILQLLRDFVLKTLTGAPPLDPDFAPPSQLSFRCL